MSEQANNAGEVEAFEKWMLERFNGRYSPPFGYEIWKARGDKDAARIAELESIAYSDDGAGGEGMRLHLENVRLKAELESLRQASPVGEPAAWAVDGEPQTTVYDAGAANYWKCQGYSVRPLYLAPPAVSANKVPDEGWQLVPKEPTPEMKAAGQAMIDKLANDGIEHYWQDVYANGYKAMIDAAPKPGEQP